MIYPMIEDVFNLARVYINDTFTGLTGNIGEGRIFIDSWTPILTILNESMDDYQRDLENGGVPILHKETIVRNIPVINGANGPGIPDAAALQYISANGFFDGTNNLAAPMLPPDMFVPVAVMQRQSSSNTRFGPLLPLPGPLPSAFQNNGGLGAWEWRGDAIWWNGSTVTQDIRIVYRASVPFFSLTLNPEAFLSTQIPLIDSLEPLAMRCAYIFTASRVPPGGAAELLQMYDRTVARIIQRYAVYQWWKQEGQAPAPTTPPNPAVDQH